MDEAIERSVDLLSRPARDLFGRLALLRGGTELAGVQATCDGDGTIGGRDAVEVFRELVDASLVIAERTPAGTWYRMLYPIQMAAGVCAALEPADAEEVLDRFATTSRRRQAVEPSGGELRPGAGNRGDRTPHGGNPSDLHEVQRRRRSSSGSGAAVGAGSDHDHLVRRLPEAADWVPPSCHDWRARRPSTDSGSNLCALVRRVDRG